MVTKWKKNYQRLCTFIKLSPCKQTLQLQMPRHAGQTFRTSSIGMSEYLHYICVTLVQPIKGLEESPQHTRSLGPLVCIALYLKYCQNIFFHPQIQSYLHMINIYSKRTYPMPQAPALCGVWGRLLAGGLSHTLCNVQRPPLEPVTSRFTGGKHYHLHQTTLFLIPWTGAFGTFAGFRFFHYSLCYYDWELKTLYLHNTFSYKDKLQ